MDCKVLSVSVLWVNVLIVLVVLATQTYGMTFVLLNLTDAFWNNNAENTKDELCNLTENRWYHVISYKFLAFFLSLTVTLYISILLHGIQDDGL